MSNSWQPSFLYFFGWEDERVWKLKHTLSST
nr:MAG TPA: hypothetical protein [Caudoviricetes sp.]